ncbi:hypothetical protein F4859DRAFT_496425 [Xylaria cf. heliscus]|nr:hypothetical protein F4859DRAFT_496425 [Xylaria cf. heliscus]
MPPCSRGTISDQASAPRTNRRKVKTGCRTCKVRHVKCDEDRPACRRCVSTGRVCDGYGIWGGGGVKGYGRAPAPGRPTDITVKPSVSSPHGKLSPEQETCFHWFRHRTYTKLPLPFITPFWNTLVLQACAVEPAILHAVLALGSAHQKESFEQGNPKEHCVALDSQQEFMLREYGKAIRSLQPHFSSQDKRSVHVALITCVLFTFFENLLGRYATANAHLHSGLRLLSETYVSAHHSADMIITNKPRGYVDDWIIESFARLHVQAALLGQGLLGLYPVLPVYPTTSIPSVFASTNEAARYMDRLLLEILHLADQCSLQDESATDPTLPAGIDDCQQRLRAELQIWLAAYNATNPDLHEGFSDVDKFYFKLLRGYHTIATLITDTCTWPACETMYDLYTADFISLIEQLIAIWKAHVARPVWHHTPWATEMPRRISHSVGDKGWIPLLHFVAVKCRVHRIRVQAIRLLSQTLHKEGIWDSKLMLVIAKEVLRIEEGDFYQDFEKDDKFNIVSIPAVEDVTLPPLPDHHRLYNIQVGLPEHPMGILTLEYEQRRGNGIGVVRRKRCYDLRVRRWTDAVNKPPLHC